KTGAALAACRAGAPTGERHEEPRLFIGVHTRPFVLHADTDVVANDLGPEVDCRPLRTELDGVADKVANHLQQPPVVGFDYAAVVAYGERDPLARGGSGILR